MNAKMYLAGVGGGILCSLLLWYPLAGYLPSTLVSDWPSTNAGLGWGLIILTGVVVLGCGAASARLSGTTTRLGAATSGALSGWIAALIGYILVSGAAAGIWGARPILEFGLKPAADEAQFIQLLVDSVTGIHWWAMLALWGSMLLGMALGALGGLLAGPGGKPDPDMMLIYQVVGVSAMLTSGLVLVIETAILTLLSRSTAEAAAKLGLVPAYSTSAILIFPVVTVFLMMLGSLWLWWFSYRRGLAAGQEMNMQVRLSATILFGVPVLTLILTFMLYGEPLFYMLYLPFFLVVILAAWGILRHVRKNSTNSWAYGLTFRVGMISVVLSFMVMAAGAYFSTVPAALGDVMLVVAAITTLTPGGSGSVGITSLVELVHEHYATYRNTGLLLTLVILPVSTLVASGLVMLMMRFATRRASQ